MKANSKQIDGNIYTILFETGEDITKESVTALFDSLVSGSKLSSVCLIVQFGPGIRYVDPSLAAIPLHLISAGKLDMPLAAAVTDSMAVRAIANGFAAAVRVLTKNQFELKALKTFDEAFAWVSAHPSRHVSRGKTV
jgi:hypothetical protein